MAFGKKNTEPHKTAEESHKRARRMEYIGPPYRTAIILPGAGECHPKTMTEDQIKEMIRQYPEVARYFKMPD